MATNAEYYQLVEKRKAILVEMKEAETRLEELTAEMVECSLKMKKVRKELERLEKNGN